VFNESYKWRKGKKTTKKLSHGKEEDGPFAEIRTKRKGGQIKKGGFVPRLPKGRPVGAKRRRELAIFGGIRVRGREKNASTSAQSLQKELDDFTKRTSLTRDTI